MNDKVPEEIQRQQLAYYGLDKPVIEQYFIYMGNLLRGDFGTSLKYVGRRVTDVIADLFPVSAKIGLVSLFFAYIIGLTFGVICAQFKNRWPDYLLTLFAIAGVALPSMVVGPLLRYYLGVQLKILPVAGWGTWQQMVMPAGVMAIGTIAGCTRSMRASMLGVTTQDYIKTARAKGLHPVKVVMKHEFKNSMVPIVTGMGATIAATLMGSFVVEQIFVIPGLGKHFVNSVNTMDYPMIMGLTIFFGSFLVMMNFLVDLIYGLIDPRIRLT
jgi:oligopeptide transport system permease protein